MRHVWVWVALCACGGVDAGNAPSPAHDLQPLSWQTSQTLLRAGSLEIDAGGETFTAAGTEVHVSGDFVEADGYSTLESIWEEHGVEMRLFIYLHTDGVSWWANEIRSYNGSAQGDWIYNDGDYFRSPVGTPFVGDVDAGNVHLRDVFMTSFLAPSCDSAPYTIEPYALLVELSTDPHIGYRMPIHLRDATCAEIAAPPGATFAWTIDDPGVATVVPVVDKTWTSAADFKGVTAGNTMTTVTLTGADGSELVHQRIPVVVDAASP